MAKKVKKNHKKKSPPSTGESTKSHPKTQPNKTLDYTFWKYNWLRALVVFALSSIFYLQGINFGYVLDDAIVIEDNQFTSKGFAGIKDIMTNESMTGYFGEQKNLVQGNRYRPLSLVTFAAEVGIFGKSPKVGHINNILIYGITCVILFWMLYMVLIRIDRKKNTWIGMAFIAALIYAIHPVHTEAVANIKGRDEIMALLFSALTVICTFKYINRSSIKYLLAACLSFFLGLLSKENAITFLAIIPASIYFFTDAKKNTYIKVILSLVITTILYLVLRFTVSGVPDFGAIITDVMNNPFYGTTSSEKYATISYTLLKYIGLSVAPITLSHDYYPYAIPIINWMDYRAILGILVHIVLVIIMIKKWNKNSIVSYSILFYLAALSIVSNIVINVGTFMNERFIFISTVGVCLLISYFIMGKLYKWNNPIGKYLAFGLLSLIFIGYSYKTYTRVPAWKSALTLNESAVKNGTNSARANSFMSTALFNQANEIGDREQKKILLTQAMTYAEKAVNLIPNYKNANLMKAGIAGEMHKLDRQIQPLLKTFKEVASNRPDVTYVIEYLDYLSGSRISDEELINFYYDVGNNELLRKKSNAKWGMHYLTKGYELTKQNSKINRAIGDAYSMLGQPNKAEPFYIMADQ